MKNKAKKPIIILTSAVALLIAVGISINTNNNPNTGHMSGPETSACNNLYVNSGGAKPGVNTTVKVNSSATAESNVYSCTKLNAQAEPNISAQSHTTESAIEISYAKVKNITSASNPANIQKMSDKSIESWIKSRLRTTITAGDIEYISKRTGKNRFARVWRKTLAKNINKNMSVNQITSTITDYKVLFNKLWSGGIPDFEKVDRLISNLSVSHSKLSIISNKVGGKYTLNDVSNILTDNFYIRYKLQFDNSNIIGELNRGINALTTSKIFWVASDVQYLFGNEMPGEREFLIKTTYEFPKDGVYSVHYVNRGEMHEVVDSKGFKRKIPVFEMVENFYEIETDMNELIRAERNYKKAFHSLIKELKRSKKKKTSNSNRIGANTNPLSGIHCSGEYWMMKDFTVTEKKGKYKIKGNVYDARKYVLWLNNVGSDVSSDAVNTVGDASGLVKKNVTVYVNKNMQLAMQRAEWGPSETINLRQLFWGDATQGLSPQNTFLFKLRKNSNVIYISDWYINYSG